MRCFRINLTSIIIFFSLFLINSASFSQPISDKKGGICFRVDDVNAVDNLFAFDSIFSKYGYKFCMSFNYEYFLTNPSYFVSIKPLIDKGHEWMDHTPSQQTQYLDLSQPQDTGLYTGDPGVDHFFGSRVCLKYSSVDTLTSHNEGLVRIEGNLIISYVPGEFNDIGEYIALYFNQLDKVCLWFNLQAVNQKDPDTLGIRSLWDENLDYGIHENIAYHKLTRNDITMSPSAIQLLGKRTLKICTDLEIPRPYSWIHPGGRMPYIPAEQLKVNLADQLSYKEAASYDYATYLSFNEFNPVRIKEFAMQYGEISIEKRSFKWNRDVISDFIAKHYMQIDLSHFSNPMGGFTAMIKRLDSLLSWCLAKNIPVNTYLQWKATLYDYTPDGSLNAFPALDVDLNEDSYPDGYANSPSLKGRYSFTDGVPESGGRCFELDQSGQICYISRLAGLEKGKNAFSIWTKGTSGYQATVKVQLAFPENEQSVIFYYPADAPEWIKYTDTITIPDSISVMDVSIEGITQPQAMIKISGMSLSTTGPFIVDFYSTKVCNGDSTTLVSTSSPIDSIQVLQWDMNGDGKFDEGVEGNVVKYVFNGAGIYNVGLRGITYSGKTKAIYKEVIVAGVMVDFDIQNGCQGQLSAFLDQSQLIGDYAAAYYWNFGDGTPESNLVNPTHDYSYPGYYQVKHSVITLTGCVDSLIRPIFIGSPPLLNLTFSGDTIFSEGDSLTVQAQGDFDNVLWSDGSTATYIIIRTTGNWWVKGYKDSCITEKKFSTTVREFGLTPVMMTIFTPNNDGFNDLWKILNLTKVGKCEVEIYDRWGIKVFASSDYRNDWDGSYNGKSLGNDTYYYFVRTLDGQLFKGTVNILK